MRCSLWYAASQCVYVGCNNRELQSNIAFLDIFSALIQIERQMGSCNPNSAFYGLCKNRPHTIYNSPQYVDRYRNQAFPTSQNYPQLGDSPPYAYGACYCDGSIHHESYYCPSGYVPIRNPCRNYCGSNSYYLTDPVSCDTSECFDGFAYRRLCKLPNAPDPGLCAVGANGMTYCYDGQGNCGVPDPTNSNVGQYDSSTNLYWLPQCG